LEYDLEEDDELVPYECRIAPISDNEVLAIVRDRTAEKRQAEEQRRRAEIDDLERRAEGQVLHLNPYHLTFREFTVLHYLTQGMPDKEIARSLYISIFTVNKHVANILSKMQAASRTEAAVRAQREGLI
jgi:DNA-binding NarL/FixJ family response regulator